MFRWVAGLRRDRRLGGASRLSGTSRLGGICGLGGTSRLRGVSRLSGASRLGSFGCGLRSLTVVSGRKGHGFLISQTCQSPVGQDGILPDYWRPTSGYHDWTEKAELLTLWVLVHGAGDNVGLAELLEIRICDFAGTVDGGHKLHRESAMIISHRIAGSVWLVP